MRQMILNQPKIVEEHPLQLVETPKPEPSKDQVLLKIKACGVCHTDLHIVEGEIHPPKMPIVPGHQVVGIIEQINNAGDTLLQVGDRVGVPWLHKVCRTCFACMRGEENLCANAEFTGFHTDGGYADYMIAWTNFIYPIPASIVEEQAAPLLCAGIIGYRSLRKADVKPGEKIGFVGFGASAHLAMQIANYWNCLSYVFTRSKDHQRHAELLGANWVGTIDSKLETDLDRIIIFAPNGNLVPMMLDRLRPGGTLAINAIYMTTIPTFPYNKIYGERTIRSITNATYKDGIELLNLASLIPIKASVEKYSLDQANEALADLKHSRINGEGVLIFSE